MKGICFAGRTMRGLILVLALFSSEFGVSVARAEEELDTPLDPQLHEEVLEIPVGTWPKVRLQVTFFRPDGAGPFPVAVLNHGKEPGLPQEAKRYRSAYAARYFVSRGYAVILPMMRGFAGSEGIPFVAGCDVEAMGTNQGRDIHDVIQYLPHSSIANWLDTSRVIIFGQSLGGWNTLAAGAFDTPGVKGLVNFAGGVNAPDCLHWQSQLVVASGHYAKATHVPSIWFYGDNDSRFPEDLWHAMRNQYEEAGGQVEIVAYGNFQDDSHNFLGHVEALPVWMPKLDAFLGKLGLPNQVRYPELLPAPYPTATDFASFRDIASIPLVDDKGREEYRKFLKRRMPRVFMIAVNGSTVTTDGGFDPLDRAKTLCTEHKLRCQPYAIDDYVVWPKPMPTPPPTQFAKLEGEQAVPYLSEVSREGYRKFLTLPKPRAFVVAPDGAWAASARDFDVLANALHLCEMKHQGCKPYALDDRVVWAVP